MVWRDGLIGRMLAVGMSEASTKELLSQATASIQIACINSPNSVVLAGPATELEAMVSLLPPGTPSSFVPGNIAFHCGLTQPIVDKLAKRLQPALSRLKGSNSASSSVPFISTVTGSIHRGPLNAGYWVDNVRQPVRFQQVSRCFRLSRPACIKRFFPYSPAHKPCV
jgi:acyl transferase domain-containing protein